MKTIFIKDDRLRKIHHDLSVKLTEMSLSGKVIEGRVAEAIYKE